MAPRVSVVIPLYNVREFLPRCLGSIRDQTFDDYEVILVDDGSSDGSLEYAAGEFGWGAHAEAVRALSQPNLGPGVARNAGIDAARGEYVLFVDGDDFVEPTLLERAVAQADGLSSDIVVWDVWFHCNVRGVDYHPPVGTLDFAQYVLPDEAGERGFTFRDNPDAIFTSFHNWPWNKLFRRSFLEECDLRFPALHHTEDLPFTCEALVRAGGISVIYERLSHYRTRRVSSAMGSRDSWPYDFIDAFLALRRRLEELGVFGEVSGSFRRWALESVVANLNALRTATAAEAVLRRLRDGGLAELGILDVDPGGYRNPYLVSALGAMLEGSLADYLVWRSHEADWLVDDLRVTIDGWERRELELLGEVSSRDLELEAARAERDRLAGELASARDRVRALETGRDYRLGSALLRAPRAIRRALRPPERG